MLRDGILHWRSCRLWTSQCQGPDDRTHFLDFVHRNSTPPRSLDIRSTAGWISGEHIDPYLLPTITSLSVNCTGLSITIPDILSKTTINRDSYKPAVLPELEHLELVKYKPTSLNAFADLIFIRWNTRNRTLKSVKLTQCSIYQTTFPVPDFSCNDIPPSQPYNFRTVFSMTSNIFSTDVLSSNSNYD